MGFFDIFKRKKKSGLSAEDLFAKTFPILFPGGVDDMNHQIEELSALLPRGKYSNETIGGTLRYMTSLFIFGVEKSAQRIVERGAMRRPDNAFTKEDALIIYNYVIRLNFKRKTGQQSEEAFEYFYRAMGNIEDGAQTDVIPGAYGEYGLCATNPVPVRGIPAADVYLKRLKLTSGEAISYKRIGSTGSPNISEPVDIYAITSSSGVKVATIYISPYQSIISDTAPKGFVIG